jgi:hypothetical protein
MDDLTENPRQKRSTLSLTGACIEHTGELTPGMGLKLDMGTLRELDGTVMWVTERLAGLRFEQPVNLDEARKPRTAGVTEIGGVQVGWMSDIRHAYRR